MATRVIAQQSDTVDTLCWRHYQRTAGVTEQVLESNRHLADLGPVLPMGTKITLPDIPAQSTKNTIKLWD